MAGSIALLAGAARKRRHRCSRALRPTPLRPPACRPSQTWWGWRRCSRRLRARAAWAPFTMRCSHAPPQLWVRASGRTLHPHAAPLPRPWRALPASDAASSAAPVVPQCRRAPSGASPGCSRQRAPCCPGAARRRAGATPPQHRGDARRRPHLLNITHSPVSTAPRPSPPLPPSLPHPRQPCWTIMWPARWRACCRSGTARPTSRCATAWAAATTARVRPPARSWHGSWLDNVEAVAVLLGGGGWRVAGGAGGAPAAARQRGAARAARCR